MTINLDQYTNTLSVTDTATNADLNVTTKGTGSVVSNVNGGTFSIARDSASNAIKLTAPNQNLYVQSSGGGVILFNTSDGASLNQMRITSTASVVNYVQVTGAATGANVTISTQGSDASVFGTLLAKGNGGWDITGNGASTFRNSAGANQFQVTPTTSAVNYVQVTGGATGNAVNLSTQGSDTNIQFNINSKNAFGIQFGTGGGTQFLVSNTAAAANYLRATGGATGFGPVLSAQGSDANIDIIFTPKGTTGNVRFGTHTGTADTAVSGYIEIKDSGGTIRKLAVIT